MDSSLAFWVFMTSHIRVSYWGYHCCNPHRAPKSKATGNGIFYWYFFSSTIHSLVTLCIGFLNTMMQSYLLYDERMGLHKDIKVGSGSSDERFENSRRITSIYKKLETLEKKIKLKREASSQTFDATRTSLSRKNISVEKPYCPFPRIKCEPAKQDIIQLAHSQRYYEKVSETSKMLDEELEKLNSIFDTSYYFIP